MKNPATSKQLMKLSKTELCDLVMFYQDHVRELESRKDEMLNQVRQQTKCMNDLHDARKERIKAGLNLMQQTVESAHWAVSRFLDDFRGGIMPCQKTINGLESAINLFKEAASLTRIKYEFSYN